MQNINPVYKSINKIDFTSYNELCDILYLDKHTRIEGLCSEAVFMEDVIQDNLHPVATGFWFTRMAKDQPGFHIRKVITDISVPLNNLDYRILDEFASIPSTPVSIVYFTEDSKSFLEFTHTKGERYDNIKDMGITIQPNDNAVIAEEKYRNKERIEKACEFLDHRGLLKNAAISRLFANRWLGRAVWDIDAFTLSSSGQIIALEVKQKYPTNNNKFGLNDGQEKLFRFLKVVFR